MGEVNILLVDADSHNGFPNLALMKLSAYHKNEGHNIDLIKGLPLAPPLALYDKSYISCIFPQNKERALQYALMLPNSVVGGSGFDYTIKLDYDIEHILPDYSLYNIDYSLGFTSRGCIRNCGFCIVPEKEGPIRDHAPITEFHDPNHKKIVLLDNNFQASPRWKENLEYIIDSKLKVNFNQGLDIRLLNDEFIELLAQTKYFDIHFKKPSLYFAFDDFRYKDKFVCGMRKLHAHGITPRSIMVYILVGFNTTLEQDLERIKVVDYFGAVPYIMRYNQINTPELNKLARWVNRKYYQFIEWKTFLNEPEPKRKKTRKQKGQETLE